MITKFDLATGIEFLGLFNNCTACPAFSECGGAKTAPCGCAWPKLSDYRYKCSKCNLICCERQVPGPDGSIYRFENHLAEGRFLENLFVEQGEKKLFPLYVPLFTYFSKIKKLPLRWAAADIATLFNKRKRDKPILKSVFDTEYSAKRYLSIGNDCDLWAVLNAKDDHLEDFWGIGEEERLETFKHLKKIGFSFGTGATFSISDITNLKTPIPQSHNVTMLTRHHQVLHELHTAGLYSVPNIYWRDGEKKDLRRWANWLIDNPQIQSISRDFTSTRNLSTNLSKLNELMELLEYTGRTFNIMIVGTGAKTAPKIMQMLARNGHSGTVISSSPIYDAAKCAIRYEIDDEKIIRLKDGDTPRSELIIHNISVFENFLSEIVIQETGQHNFLRNLMS